MLFLHLELLSIIMWIMAALLMFALLACQKLLTGWIIMLCSLSSWRETFTSTFRRYSNFGFQLAWPALNGVLCSQINLVCHVEFGKMVFSLHVCLALLWFMMVYDQKVCWWRYPVVIAFSAFLGHCSHNMITLYLVRFWKVGLLQCELAQWCKIGVRMAVYCIREMNRVNSCNRSAIITAR